jgi:iron complex outermembrane receptor protein
MSLEKLAGSSLIAIALCAATPVQAQDLAPSLADESGSAQDAQPVDSGEIVVTALRRNEKLRDVPVSITAVNAEGLEKAGIANLRDLGNIAPGLVFTGQNGLASPTIRGVQSTLGQAGAESPTAIYIDGVYQPNIAANFQDLADVEHVEVLKGPQGTLFGRNATGGAVVVRTVDPSFSPKGSFTVSDGIYTGGSARTSHDIVVKGYVAGPIVDDLIAGSISGFYEWVDGYLTNDLNGKRTGRIEKYNVRAKLLVQPADNLKIVVAGFYSHKNDETSFASQPLNGNTNVQFYEDGVVPTKIWHVASPLRNGVGQHVTTTKSVYGKVDWDLGDGIGSLSSLTSYLDVKARLIVPIAAAHSPTCVASFNCIIYHEEYPGQTFQQEISFTSARWGDFQLVAGAMYFSDKNTIVSDINPVLDANGDLAAPGPVYLVGTIKTKAWAGFGEVTWDATDRLHFLAGLRYSREKRSGFGNLVPRFPSTGPVVDTAWTPRLSVRYDVSSAANVYFTYSKGFKSAVLQSIEQNDQGASPEHVTSYEIGAKVGSPGFGFNVAAYYYDYKDLQVQFFDGAVTILTNAANAKIYGIEGDVHYQITPELEIQANASWLAKAEYRNFTSGVAFALPNSPTGMGQVVVDASGQRMLKAPKFTGGVTLSYAKMVKAGEITATATYSYVSDFAFDLLRRVHTGGYGTLNGNVGFQPEGSDWKFTLFGRNITNEIYFSGSLLGGQADAPSYNPPRQIGLQVNYRF